MTHFTGEILSILKRATYAGAKAIRIDNRQSNATHGVHQARVRFEGDPQTYRLILAPADAPIMIDGQLIGEHFAEPLGEM